MKLREGLQLGLGCRVAHDALKFSGAAVCEPMGVYQWILYDNGAGKKTKQNIFKCWYRSKAKLRRQRTLNHSLR